MAVQPTAFHGRRSRNWWTSFDSLRLFATAPVCLFRKAGSQPQRNRQMKERAMNHESAVQFQTESRIHMGLAVKSLERSVAFYRTLFGQEPTKTRHGGCTTFSSGRD